MLFKAKINGEYVTITSFDYKAQDVVIPAAMNYDGTVYPVKEIDVFGNAFYKTRIPYLLHQDFCLPALFCQSCDIRLF